MSKNKGFDPKEIEKWKNEMAESNSLFVFSEEEENTEDYAEFFFIGKFKGEEVIYDAAMYTLSLSYENKLDEEAEEKALQKYPGNAPFVDGPKLSEEDFESYKAYLMAELEEEDAIKVCETIEYDEEFEFGVGLEVCLNVEEITKEVIVDFINRFNSGTFAPDPTMFSFEDEE